ncbi:MAG: TfoX/Sxy family protein [Hyphomicrobiales bacterium]|nr:TfoX/Sxy family protein [Hyphomicrobiales bacterium]
MAVSAEYMGYIADLLAPLARRAGDVRVRRMFGGAGVYYQRRMFGLIADETLYFKADKALQERHRAHGCGPFVFRPAGKKPIAMSYWQVPEPVLEDEEELLRWARDALGAAHKRPASKSSAAKSSAAKSAAAKRPTAGAPASKAELDKTLKEHAPWLI